MSPVPPGSGTFTVHLAASGACAHDLARHGHFYGEDSEVFWAGLGGGAIDRGAFAHALSQLLKPGLGVLFHTFLDGPLQLRPQ